MTEAADARSTAPRHGASVLDRMMASRRGGWMAGPRPGRRSTLAALIWLAFIVFPLVNAVTNQGSTLDKVLTITAATLFVASYVWMVLTAFGSHRRTLALTLCGVLIALALALTIGDRPGWGFLFSYCAACVALLWPADTGFLAIVVLTLVAGGACVAGGGSAGEGVGYGASTIGVGLLMVLLRDLRTRNDELNQARAELADVAVAQERERFARDLHDLLGHSLSVIALKAELAGKLMAERPGDAAVEVREVRWSPARRWARFATRSVATGARPRGRAGRGPGRADRGRDRIRHGVPGDAGRAGGRGGARLGGSGGGDQRHPSQRGAALLGSGNGRPGRRRGRGRR